MFMSTKIGILISHLQCRAAADRGLIAVNSSSLMAGGKEANVSASVTLLQEASSQVFFTSIPAELLSVPYNTSQVWFGFCRSSNPTA